MKLAGKIVAFIFILFTSGLYSQQVHVDAVLDTSRMRIGEQAKIDIYVSYSSRDRDINIQWPSVGDTITGKVEVISVSPIDTTFPDKTNSAKIFQHQQIIVSVYDSGYYAIPGFKFIINKDTSKPAFTTPLFLEVHTVPTDTSAAKLKDIKPPFDEKFNWKWYLNYIYFGVALLVLIIVVILVTRYYARKNRQVILEPEKPKIPAHITALASLEKIKTDQVWREGKVKEYYSSISETIRTYIEERFNLNALESTTDEIMKAFRSQVVDKESKEKLQQLLTLSDLVKFAKMFPIEEEHSFTLQNAFDFVNGTRREDEVLPEMTNAENPNTPIDPPAAPLAEEQGSQDPYMPGNYKIPGTKSTAPPIAPPVKTGRVMSLEKAKAEKKKLFIILTGIIIFAVGASFIQKEYFSTSDKSPTIEAAATINKICPVMVDNELRLDHVTAEGEKDIQFNFTFVNIQTGQMDVDLIKQQVEPAVLNEVKTNPQLEILRNSNVTFKYSYNDKEGKFLFSTKITPEEYKTIN